MMRLMLLLSLLVLLPLPARALDTGGGVWRAKTLHVHDYSPEVMEDGWRNAVTNANAILPARAPEVVYHRMTPATCADVDEPRDTVVICLGDPSTWPVFMQERNTYMMALFTVRKRIMRNARIEVDPVQAQRITQANFTQAACHELIGHGILGLSDNYDSMTGEESCLYGRADKPGTWDQAVARWLYKKFAKPHKNR